MKSQATISVQGSVYGGHHFDMTGAPEYMQDELIEADDQLDQIDNHSVLLEYGIDLSQNEKSMLILSEIKENSGDISRSFHSENEM